MRLFLAVGLTLLLASTGVVSAQREAEDEQRRRVENELRQQVKELEESPNAPAAWHEARALFAQLKSEQDGLELAQKDRWKRHQELTRRDDYKDWERRVDVLREAVKVFAYERHELVARAKVILEERQAELAAIAPAEVPRARELGLTLVNHPAIDCSTSVAPLAAILACRMLDCPYEWGAYGKMTMDPMWISAAGAPLLPDQPRPEFPDLQEYRVAAKADGGEANRRKTLVINQLLLPVGGTHGAYVSLIEGKSDLILVARQPSADERQLAATAGLNLDARPFARDALVFLVNHMTPIESLTEAQLRDIFSDPEKAKQAGLRAHLRQRNSGSGELMQNLVMRDREQQGQIGYSGSYGMGGPFINMTWDDKAIGYSVYYYARFMAGSPAVKLIGVNGVQPTFDTIRDGTYPYVTEVYAVVRADTPPDNPAVKLRDWLLTAEGQAVVRESGYVPLPANP